MGYKSLVRSPVKASTISPVSSPTILTVSVPVSASIILPVPGSKVKIGSSVATRTTSPVTGLI